MEEATIEVMNEATKQPPGSILPAPYIASVKDKEIVIIGKPGPQTPVGERRGAGHAPHAVLEALGSPWGHEAHGDQESTIRANR